jgi:hypothetical protein
MALISLSSCSPPISKPFISFLNSLISSFKDLIVLFKSPEVSNNSSIFLSERVLLLESSFNFKDCIFQEF